MSAGHKREQQFTPKELDDLLAEVLDNPRVKRRLAQRYNVDTSYDIALLGSSAIDGRTVYFDRHLQYPGKPYGILPLQKRWFNVIPSLIRHERLEQTIENVFGWKYEVAHEIATHWEEQLVKEKGFDPQRYEKLLDPYIKRDETQKLTRVPIGLDMRPLFSNSEPEDKSIIEQQIKITNREKRSQASVGYVEKSKMPKQKCALCKTFVSEKYSGPRCVLVKDPINAGGWCRRFRKGALDDSR